MREFTVDSNISGSRLDKIAAKFIGNASQGFVHKMLRKKNITLNDKKADGSEILKEGDVVKIYISESTFEMFEKPAEEKTDLPKPDILFEDENIIAVNKPAGILSMKSNKEDVSENDIIVSYLGSDSFFMPGISNRLDRNTSGIILAGKNTAASRLLNEAIKTRAVTKHYLTVVGGKTPENGIYEAYLTKDAGSNTVKVTESGDEKDKIYTGVETIASNGRFSLVRIDLITGKPHQIRAHMAYLGSPVCGDTKYGDKVTNNYFRGKYGLKRQLLHASEVEFAGMCDKLEYLNGTVIKAPLPEDFEGILKGENLWQHGIPED